MSSSCGQLQICTMTIGCKFNCHVNHFVLSRYLPLDSILFKIVYYEYSRTFESPDSKIEPKIEPKDSYFQSQTTIWAKVNQHILNLKLFDNGSLLIVGCLSIQEAELILKLLVERLTVTQGDWVIPVDWNCWENNFISHRKKHQDVKLKLQDQWDRGVRQVEQISGTIPNVKTKRERLKYLSNLIANNLEYRQQALSVLVAQQIKSMCGGKIRGHWDLQGNWVINHCESNDLDNRWQPGQLEISMINCYFEVKRFPASKVLVEWIQQSNLPLLIHENDARSKSRIECEWKQDSDPFRVVFYLRSRKINLSARRSLEDITKVYQQLSLWINKQLCWWSSSIIQPVLPYRQIWVNQDASEAYVTNL